MSYERNRRLALGLLQDSANLARVARDTGIPYQTIYSFSKMDPKDSLNWRWDLIAERILRVRCPEKLDNTKPLDEAETLGWVKDYFLNHISAENRKISESRLWDIQDNFGIPVTRHPSWHPLSFEFDNPEVGEHDCWRFGHLDHTRYFVNAILTCPYGEGREILAKVKELQEAQRPEGYEWKYTLKATPLEEKLYSEDANPILISCEWNLEDYWGPQKPFPRRFIMEHVLRRQLASADRAKVGEYWVTMEPYFCGRTFEDSPSPFVDKLTAVSLREMQMTLNTVEFFGPARSPYKEKLSVEETEEARELAERAALLLGKLG